MTYYRSFVESLEVVQEVFVKSVLEHKPKNPITDVQTSTIFQNLKELLEFHKKVYSQLAAVVPAEGAFKFHNA